MNLSQFDNSIEMSIYILGLPNPDLSFFGIPQFPIGILSDETRRIILVLKNSERILKPFSSGGKILEEFSEQMASAIVITNWHLQF